MHSVAKLALCAGGVASALMMASLGSCPVQAQGTPKAMASDPAGPTPDPTHIPFTLPKDIKWTGSPTGQETAILYGDPNKEGPYALLIKWHPGAYSHPHFHDKERHIYVVSGTWWVSSSSTYDEKQNYPMRAGTLVTDVANTIHYDGTRCDEKEPGIILLTGLGPVKTVQVGPDGKPLPDGVKAPGMTPCPAGR